MMQSSLLFCTATRLLVPLILVLSVLLLVRGHDAAGGGFIAGLMAGAGFVLQGLAFGPDQVRRATRVGPRPVIGAGVALVALSGFVGPLVGEPFLTGVWFENAFIKLGSPILFDTGIFLVVVGVLLVGVFGLAPRDEVPGPEGPR